jgi:hypothetical protein
MATEAQKKSAANQRAKHKAEGLKPYLRPIKPEFFPKMDECLEKLKKQGE